MLAVADELDRSITVHGNDHAACIGAVMRADASDFAGCVGYHTLEFGANGAELQGRNPERTRKLC